jgi:hypothetical protein
MGVILLLGVVSVLSVAYVLSEPGLICSPPKKNALRKWGRYLRRARTAKAEAPRFLAIF